MNASPKRGSELNHTCIGCKTLQYNINADLGVGTEPMSRMVPASRMAAPRSSKASFASWPLKKLYRRPPEIIIHHSCLYFAPFNSTYRATPPSDPSCHCRLFTTLAFSIFRRPNRTHIHYCRFNVRTHVSLGGLQPSLSSIYEPQGSLHVTQGLGGSDEQFNIVRDHVRHDSYILRSSYPANSYTPSGDKDGSCVDASAQASFLRS
ncbi:MAG: hypothetical protein JOS17DRAFT_538522 [Linnemannia elongata]|nr:MAG: hypothetical protein JOS17DRAFT_538522 [Linnemannia elongata]